MKRFRDQFPPQTGTYAVKVKTGAGWRDFDTVRLQMSVGMPYHEGDKLAATLDWCRHRFRHVIVCVNDTLQRFNHQFDGMDPRQAYDKSLADGDSWIERNGAAVAALPSAEVHRWDDWKTWPDFAVSMARTQNLARTNPEFQEALSRNIMDFWQRRQKKTGFTEAHRFAEFSRLSEAYLIEETAIFSQMFKAARAVDVYPGSVLLPCVVFQGRQVEGAPEGLDRGAFTRIDFASREKARDPAPAAQVQPPPAFAARSLP